MNRGDFASLFGRVAAALPLPGYVQQPGRVRRIGVLSYFDEQDPQSSVYLTAFLKQLEEFGWTIGKNLQVESRWTGCDADRIHQYAAELVALAPDVILAPTGSHVWPLQQITSSIPIVFVQVGGLGIGSIESVTGSNGNVTGFTNFAGDLGGKWLELLKQIAPRTTRVAVLRSPDIRTGRSWPVPLMLMRSLNVDVGPVDLGLGLGHAGEIEHGITEFAEMPNGGLIVLPSAFSLAHRELIVSLAREQRLPAIYPSRDFVVAGGLMSYGHDPAEQYRRAAGYVDYILNGVRPVELPVRESTKLELVINRRTAKALGLDVPPSLISAAVDVIDDTGGQTGPGLDA
jgi:putative ABC transport system substrate-binding protein